MLAKSVKHGQTNGKKKKIYILLCFTMIAPVLVESEGEVGEESRAAKGPFEVSAIFDPPAFLAPYWLRLQETADS